MTDHLEQANAWQAEICSNSQSNSAYQEFCVHKYHEMVRILPGLVAECERLHQDNKYLGDRWTGQSAKIIDMQIELVRWQKIAIEELAWSEFNEAKLGSRQDISFDEVADDFREQAARELGIATSDHIRDTTKMMLTEEQRAALEIAIEIYEVAIKKNFESDPVSTILESAGLRHDIDVFKAMLAQSRPAWEITEERRRAIELAQYGFRGFPQDTIDASIAELQDMLDECQK